MSLTPSLIPRGFAVQSIVSGLSLAVGYALGLCIAFIWNYLEIPRLSQSLHRRISIASLVVCGGLSVFCLWKASGWQDSIRGLMGLDPLDSFRPLEVGLVAALVFLVCLVLGRLFRMTQGALRVHLSRFVPRRIALVISIGVAGFIFWSAADGLIFRTALRIADSSFRALDEIVEIEGQRPIRDAQSGSATSLLDWNDLGRAGRSYVSDGPDASEITKVTTRSAMDPLRVYVGLRSAKTVEQRAELALKELIRVGGFDRSVLIIATPTGTGWMDPAAFDSLEFLHAGNVATVSVQYSYLASWISLLVEPEYGAESSRALFKEVYRHWKTLLPARRPRLYLFGLSLGALNSASSINLIELLEDPIQGAVWAGPPFLSRMWKSVTLNRNEGSPAWLPRYSDQSIVRFTSQTNAITDPQLSWGPIRVAYLQYASDPIVFFEPDMFFLEPQWMKPPRGPDVSPSLKWFPLVTGIQLIVDMATATTAPIGYGHIYAPSHYINAWLEITKPQNWFDEDVARLKQYSEQRLRQSGD